MKVREVVGISCDETVIAINCEHLYIKGEPSESVAVWGTKEILQGGNYWADNEVKGLISYALTSSRGATEILWPMVIGVIVDIFENPHESDI